LQFIDLVTQQKRIRDKIEANITAVLDHGKYIMGPEIKTLEQRLADPRRSPSLQRQKSSVCWVPRRCM